MSLSVRVRFEVFKRDRFTCAYCGKHPPDVLLEVDHVIPKAAGGSDEITNLVTACWDCNHGKSDRLLEEGTAPVVSRATIEDLAERLEQANAYMQLLGGLSALIDRQVQMVIDAWAHAFGATPREDAERGTYWTLESAWGEAWPNVPSIKRFLRALPLAEVLEAIDIAAARFQGLAGTNSTRYFYGVCHRAIKRGREVSSPAASEEAVEQEAIIFRQGAEVENRRIHNLFLRGADGGFTAAEVVAELWPEDD